MDLKYPKELYDFFAEYVKKHAGIEYKETNYYQLDGRLSQLVQLGGYDSPEKMWDQIKVSVPHHLHEHIVDLATNNETSFFRDGRPFEILKQHIFPILLEKNKSDRKIKFWSAASSTGQEVWSTMMTWHENFGAHADWNLDLKGTDISDRVIQQCRNAVYSQLESQRGLPVAMLMKYFEQVDGGRWKIKDQYLNKASFSVKNLLEGSFGSNQFDIVFCRNVLIYQPTENKQIILNNIFDSLKPGGFLVMGAGESLIGLKTEYKKVTYPEGSVFQKPDPSEMEKAA